MWKAEFKHILSQHYEPMCDLNAVLNWINCDAKNMEQVFTLFGLRTRSYKEYNDAVKNLNVDQDIQMIWVNTKELDHWCVIVRSNNVYHYFDSMKNHELYEKICKVCKIPLKYEYTSPCQQENDLCFAYVLLYAIQRYHTIQKNETNFLMDTYYAKHLLKYICNCLPNLTYKKRECPHVYYRL